MPYKKVNYEIRVPEDKYCWKQKEPSEICMFFNNGGGNNVCALGFHGIGRTNLDGALKPKDCLKLKNAT